MNVINEQGTGDVGQQFGNTIAQGIQNIAQQRTAQMQQKEIARQFHSLGLPPELAKLPEGARNAILKEILGEHGVAGYGANQQGPEDMGGMQPRVGSKALAREQANREAQVREERKQTHALEKGERPFYDKTVNDYTASKNTLNDLDRMVELINKGGVVNPTVDHMQRWLSKTLKVNLKDLRGADTEEFEKLTAGFIKNAKQWFGSRVTDFDLQSFLKTLPELSVSHEGKMRLIGSMKAAAQAQQIRYNALKQIMKDNNGRIPPYASMLVEDMVAPQLDQLADDFISGAITPQLSKKGQESANAYGYLRPIKAGLGALQTAGGTLGGLLGNAVGGLATGIGIKKGFDLLGK